MTSRYSFIINPILYNFITYCFYLVDFLKLNHWTLFFFLYNNLIYND